MLFAPVVIFISIFFNTLGQSAENASMVKWMSAIPGPKLSVWCVLLITGIAYVTFFFVLHTSIYLVMRIGKSSNACWWPGPKLTLFNLLIGAFDGLNGVFIVFFSSAERTPPIFQAFASNLGPFFAAFLMKIPALRTNSNPNYNVRLSAPLAMLALGLGVAAPVLTNYSDFTQHQETTSLGMSLYSCSMFIIGALFGTFYNVLQHPYLTQRQAQQQKRLNSEHFPILSKELPTTNSIPSGYTPTFSWTFREAFMMLFWETLGLVTFICAIWFTDLIPNFGTSSDLSDFAMKVKATWNCSWGLDNTCTAAMYSQFIFNSGYIVAYVSSAVLNYVSPVLNAVSAGLTQATMCFIWLYWKSLIPGVPAPLVWVAYTSLAMSVLSTLIWTKYEHRVNAKTVHGVADLPFLYRPLL